MVSYQSNQSASPSAAPEGRVLKYHLTSLGCPKNLVESEQMMAELAISGMVLVHDPEDADLLIVNTCGFINPAKEESIEVILDLAESKQRNPGQRLMVVGCMVQRYREDMQKDIPEVDAFVGVEDREAFLTQAWQALGSKPINDLPPHLPYQPRLLTTPPHMAYLRISDGCFHTCSFCAIPKMRGTLVSRSIEENVAEAKALAAGGAKELVLISQDTTSYGIDLYKRPAITELLAELEKIEGVEWIRLMYLYPHLVDRRLVSYFAQSEKLVSYIDMPIQHAHPDMLDAMKRGSTDVHIRKAVENLRNVRPDLTARTTAIVGFPGEKAHHFDYLMQMLDECDFDRIGVFPYSDEDGTPAADMTEKVSQRIIDKRCQKVIDWASERQRKKNERFLGESLKVLIDSKDVEGEGYWGRYYGQAPDVDGQVFVRAQDLTVGEFASVRIHEADEDNLYGCLSTEVIPNQP
ncbi:MAG: 30S ribosomal protein S12 methylthiotransferase RimO [Candidatus Hinthialibacter antarcticus]|nr:30S ribosomal protein S12 methylthiotransferase RimO [Candidatus Hinthialibacter antarcticus]